jgi:hypothetical protein
MGLAVYYKRFIVGFFEIAHPITSLQKKGVKFEWGVECEEIFRHLKNLLTRAPILKVASLDEDFFVLHMHARNGSVESLHKMDM